MLPPKWRDLGQEPKVDLLAAVNLFCDDLVELPCGPVDDDGSKEVEASNSMLLALGRPASDFAAPVAVDRTLQGMMGLTLVQSDLCSALQINAAQ